jgi:hypothetical protein
MAWILRTLWLDLRSCIRAIGRWSKSGARCGPQSMPTSQPVDGAVTPLAPAKRFYSLIIEVRPSEADAETLLLFSDEAGVSLATTLNLPTGCKFRRCTSVSPDFAEILINM